MVSTPIGNLEDITLRALRILKEADLIAAEDTRKTNFLLSHYKISTPTISFYSYNQVKKTPELLDFLSQGKSLALVTDAGTPGISDPAYYLVTRAIQAGVTLVPVPGPTAFIAGLIASGLPTRRFVFEGFLPLKKGRKTRLMQLAQDERTIVLYESPHRIQRTLDDILKYFGDRHIVIARELTKLFEEFIRGKLSQVIMQLSEKKLKGELVLIIEGNANFTKEGINSWNMLKRKN
ncbi:MAG: 16S rRNA (cytidine(1402)-2'-O)-methyltransferase [Calditrichaeota bacterium]|nr:16S rRNA (cytidine(1402)-2'-O)-methyltransferase [Calditrichota bacterium]